MGFWSTFAKIAGDVGGSFIGDPMLGNQVVGVIQGATGWDTGAKAGAVGAGIGSLLGGPGAQLGKQASTTLPTFPTDPSTNAAESYYRTALNGSSTATQSLLNPQVSTVLDQYDNAAKTAANLGPRGGGRTAIMAAAPFKKAGAYGQALAGATSGAARELGQLGSQNQGQQAQYAEEQARVNAQQNQLMYQGQQAANKQAAGVGGGIANILTSIVGGKGSNPVTGPSGSGSTGGSVFGSAMDSALGLGGQGDMSSFS